jgi:hypothetical protein
VTYKLRYNIPFLKYLRSDGSQDPISSNYTKDCGSDPAVPVLIYHCGLPAGLTTRDFIHVRVAIKEPTGDTDAGFKLHLCTSAASYDANDLLQAYTFDPGDTDQEAKYPVAQMKVRVNSDLVTASANATALRAYGGPSTGSSTVKIHGLMVWVEKNVGGP